MSYAIRIVAVENIIHREAATVNMSADNIILICHHGAMTDKKPIQPGPIGLAVAHNVEKLRESQNLSYAELSRRLTELGRPIAPLGLTRIRDRQRRVDADDLVALALALDVSPATLLLPPEALVGGANSTAPVTEGGADYPLRQIWSWLIAEAPIDAPRSIGLPSRSVLGFQLRAVPQRVGPPDSGIVNAAKLLGIEGELQKLAEQLQEAVASQEGYGTDGDN
jgi:transcriptional regulator with XRE-family HTH domain